ncbi:MAG: AMP-binding protein, partial [bacterium]|nr:AMP-binding protein [bacterium]
MDAGNLKDRLIKNYITTTWMTSTLFNRLSEVDIEIFSRLKHLLVGGEALSPYHINRVRRRFPRLNVINGYGPTENVTFSTTFRIEKVYRESIPIGNPIANSTAYVVDKYFNLVPVGVKGELIVGGAGVSRGYLGDMNATKLKFIDYPPVPGERVYKTGDLVKRLPDGNLEFIGRIDSQVKLRGYRIELGEIENRLLQHGTIKEAVVLAHEDEKKDKYLCAYIVTGKTIRNKTAKDFPEIKEYLAKNLPSYMLPSFFVELEKIPLTANGKVDREAMPKPGRTAEDDYIAPRTDMEKILVDTWSEVLSVDKKIIGIGADFFQLGGHSLIATILTAKLHKVLNVKVPLTVIFQCPTIRLLSEYINSAQKEKHQCIEPVEKKEYYQLSSAQKRLYLLQQMTPGSTAYNIPETISVGTEAGMELDKERLENTFIELIQRHESLRTSFEIVNEEPVQIIRDSVEFEPAYCTTAAPSAGSSPTITPGDNFVRPFDLSHAPLLRVALVDTGEKRVLSVDMHHIISDGVS